MKVNRYDIALFICAAMFIIGLLGSLTVSVLSNENERAVKAQNVLHNCYVVTLDRCQYIVYDNVVSSSIVHKQNCKNCLELSKNDINLKGAK